MSFITVHSKEHLPLGRFQRLVLLELEGPRERTVSVSLARGVE